MPYFAVQTVQIFLPKSFYQNQNHRGCVPALRITPKNGEVLLYGPQRESGARAQHKVNLRLNEDLVSAISSPHQFYKQKYAESLAWGSTTNMMISKLLYKIKLWKIQITLAHRQHCIL